MIRMRVRSKNGPFPLRRDKTPFSHPAGLLFEGPFRYERINPSHLDLSIRGSRFDRDPVPLSAKERTNLTSERPLPDSRGRGRFT
jgi:hypothetical protein